MVKSNPASAAEEMDCFLERIFRALPETFILPATQNPPYSGNFAILTMRHSVLRDNCPMAATNLTLEQYIGISPNSTLTLAESPRGAYHRQHKFVITTGAYPNFLPRQASNDHGCGSPWREPQQLHQRHKTRQEIRGSVVPRPLVNRLTICHLDRSVAEWRDLRFC